MSTKTTQNQNTVNGGDIVAGDKLVTNHVQKKTKLSSLFEKLKQSFGDGQTVKDESEDLKRYSIPRDTIGLEQKLINANLQHQLDDAAWLKEQYAKKLTKFQFYEHAQEIHAFFLGIVLEKFRNIVYPMIQNGNTELEVRKAISAELIEPIIQTIQAEGCDDIMGLSSTDIEGMIFYLTGQCHIKWVKT